MGSDITHRWIARKRERKRGHRKVDSIRRLPLLPSFFFFLAVERRYVTCKVLKRVMCAGERERISMYASLYKSYNTIFVPLPPPGYVYNFFYKMEKKKKKELGNFIYYLPKFKTPLMVVSTITLFFPPPSSPSPFPPPLHRQFSRVFESELPIMERIATDFQFSAFA